MTVLRTFAGAVALLLLVALPGFSAEAQTGPSANENGPGWGYGMMGGYGYGPTRGHGHGGPGYGYGAMWGYGRFGMGPWMMGGMWGYGDEDTAVAFVDGRLGFLKAELKITEKQMPEWNAFADAVRTNAKDINARVRPLFADNWAEKPLPERLDEQEKLLVARLEAFKRMSATVKPLYASLDEAQKKMADVILLGPMGGFHRGPF